MTALAIIGALFVSVVVGNLAGHGVEHFHYARTRQPLSDVRLLAFTFAVIGTCLATLLTLF